VPRQGLREFRPQTKYSRSSLQNPALLNFNVVTEYGLSSSGIEVPIVLSIGVDRRVALAAKIDTGAESCIFQRAYAELLGLRMDDGERRRFSTAIGSFETRSI
jgi:hypothetical protein